jgi:hypothetical protein
MSRISDRHEGTAGDQLDAFERTRAQEVRIVVEPEVAASASVQHTAWMLVNALARLQGVVARIELECPRDVTVRTRVVPLSNRDRLLGAIEDAAEQIGAVPMGKVRDDAFVLHIGPGGAPSSGLRVVGDAWSGGISTRAVGPGRGSALPFGPYVAACVAAAEVFKAARMKREAYVPAQAAFYSTWSHQSSIQPIDDGPVVLDGVALQADLAGVGAVGSAWVHALWATEGIRGAVQLIDNDPHGVDSTNLNRYALFGAGSVGRSKPDEAARLTAGSDIAWTPNNAAFEAVTTDPARLIISAVDRNSARDAIQAKFFGRVLGGSTSDLRAEILRPGPSGACLRCFNEPEALPNDTELRRRWLTLSLADKRDLAARRGVSLEQGDAWAATGTCGVPGERLLPDLKALEPGPRLFAVSFVSMLAGAMLAAETVKEVTSAAAPLSGRVSRAVLQLWSPAAPTNRAGAFVRDPVCPRCDPRSPAAKLWRERFRQWGSRP